MKNELRIVAVVVTMFGLTACEDIWFDLNYDGACEARWGTGDYSYYCFNETEGSCYQGYERWFVGESCSDLGYTEKGTGDSPVSTHFVSPSGQDTPGSYGYFATGSGGESLSASSGSGSGSGSSSACAGTVYNGPEFNIQIDSQCKTAYAYTCSGNSDGVEIACGIYKQYQQEDSSIPDCPYCD